MLRTLSILGPFSEEMNEAKELAIEHHGHVELMDCPSTNSSNPPTTIITNQDALTQVFSFTFICDICLEKFTDQFHFFGHLKNHYDNQPQPEQLKPEEIPAPDPAPTHELPTKVTTPKKKQANKKIVAVKSAPPVVAVPLEANLVVVTNKCRICQREFKKPHNLRAHMRYTHSESSVVQQDENPASSHNLKEEPSNPTTSYMTGESMTVDGNEVKIQIQFEEEEDVGITLNEKHENVTEDFQCSNFGELFVSSEGLAEHCAYEHGEETESPSTRARSRHGLGEGKIKDTLKCPECDRIFNHRNSLNYHMRSHTGERPHQCQICGKSFFATSALKVHMRLHSGEKPYSCNHCGRYFRQWGDLKYHVISIHSNIRQYQCEFCGKDFARKYSLIVHRRIHTGERNYKCEFCGKTFRAASYLQNHRRIHTGEKPHICNICSKPFRVRSDMKRHMTSHSRDHQPRDRQKPTDNRNQVKTNDGIEIVEEPHMVSVSLNSTAQIIIAEGFNPTAPIQDGVGETIQVSLIGSEHEHMTCVSQEDPLGINDHHPESGVTESQVTSNLHMASGHESHSTTSIHEAVVYPNHDGSDTVTIRDTSSGTLYVLPVHLLH